MILSSYQKIKYFDFKSNLVIKTAWDKPNVFVITWVCYIREVHFTT
jgi:hypothetical protein